MFRVNNKLQRAHSSWLLKLFTHQIELILLIGSKTIERTIKNIHTNNLVLRLGLALWISFSYPNPNYLKLMTRIQYSHTHGPRIQAYHDLFNISTFCYDLSSYSAIFSKQIIFWKAKFRIHYKRNPKKVHELWYLSEVKLIFDN